MHGFSTTPVHLPAWLAAALLAAALGLPPVLADEDAERAVPAGIVHKLEGLEALQLLPVDDAVVSGLEILRQAPGSDK